MIIPFKVEVIVNNFASHPPNINEDPYSFVMCISQNHVLIVKIIFVCNFQISYFEALGF
jgi:hypothetical protein